MGVVYKAHDRTLDETIALKALVEGTERVPELVQRFKLELKVARRLSHPNIARLHDMVELDGRLYLSMEYIPGTALSALLSVGPLSAARTVRYLSQLAPALDLAHRLGIVHRDLKPGNIVIDFDDTAHILDYGIAKSAWSDETRAGEFAGTPRYMAPEQWMEGESGVAVDGRADLYSLGVMLYEMLAGEPPFDSSNRFMLMDMHRSRAPRRLGAIVDNVPPALEEVVMRLLEKARDNRFDHAGDAVEALAAAHATATSPEALVHGFTPPPTPRPHSSSAPIRAMEGAKGKVLLADPDPERRATLVARLRALDLVVVQASSGDELLTIMHRDLPDLVVMDRELPILDAIDVLRLAKSDPNTRAVPMVVAADGPDAGKEALARELGAASCLERPFPDAVLELLIGRYFG